MRLNSSKEDVKMFRFGKVFVFVVCSVMLLSLTAARKRSSDSEDSKPDAAAEAKPAASANMIDDMSMAPAGWFSEVDSGATVKLGSTKGQKGKALEISYNFNGGNWLGARKTISDDLSNFKGIRFAVRGEGASNSIEVKFENSDYSNFGKLMPVKSNTGAWTTIEIPFTDLTYFWGASQQLDLKKTVLHIAISKKDSDDGGVGKMIIDGIELYK